MLIEYLTIFWYTRTFKTNKNFKYTIRRLFFWKQFCERVKSVGSVNTCFIIIISIVEFMHTIFHTPYGSFLSLLHQNKWHLLSLILRSFVKTALFPWLQCYNVKARQRFPTPEICVSITRVPHQTSVTLQRNQFFNYNNLN